MALFLMEGSRVMESLDSLWFFTNIFSSENQSLGSESSDRDEITTQVHVEESSREELSEPITPILQNQLNELILMEGSRVMESLDSLLFFTNIFSSENQSLGDEITVSESSKEELSEPITPILQNQQNELPPSDGNSVPSCPKFGEFSAEAEPQIVKQKQERRRARRRRRMSGLNQRRKILGELDLKEVSDSGCWMFGETCRYNQQMPPINDNMAMKAHIKSWAYAVACTVR